MYGKFTKCPNFTSCLPENIIFLDFLGVVGEGNPLAPSPTPMAGPQAPHQLNPALLWPLKWRSHISLNFSSDSAVTHRLSSPVLIFRALWVCTCLSPNSITPTSPSHVMEKFGFQTTATCRDRLKNSRDKSATSPFASGRRGNRLRPWTSRGSRHSGIWALYVHCLV